MSGVIVHIVGEVQSAVGFGEIDLYCKWNIVTSDDSVSWRLIDGEDSGQTWIARPTETDGFVGWNHPLDISYRCAAIQGWPKIAVQVFSSDAHQRSDIQGYGVTFIPFSKGQQTVSIPCYRPKGSTLEEVQAYSLGGNPQYADSKFVSSHSSRAGHCAVSTGEVVLQLSVVIKDMPLYVATAPLPSGPHNTPCTDCHSNKSAEAEEEDDNS